MASEGFEPPRDAAHEIARKVNPAYTDGELVRVAGGRNLAEAELIQGMLLEEGVPSVLRRSAGFDVPDFLAAGPRDVLVPEAGLEVARDVLLVAEMAPRTGPPDEHPLRQALTIAAVVLAAALLTALVAWLLLPGSG